MLVCVFFLLSVILSRSMESKHRKTLSQASRSNPQKKTRLPLPMKNGEHGGYFERANDQNLGHPAVEDSEGLEETRETDDVTWLQRQTARRQVLQVGSTLSASITD